MPRLNVTFRCSCPFDNTQYPQGREVAEYLSRRFIEAGIPITKLDSYDDFAWSLETISEGKKLFLLLGFVGDGDFEWLLQINAYTSIWNLFRRDQTLVVREAMAKIVHQSLEADEAVTAIRWHIGNFNEEGYTSSP